MNGVLAETKQEGGQENAVASKPAGEPGWDKARQWADWAAKFERGSLACQIMAGFELLALHKQHGIQAGQPKKEFCHRDKILFPDLIREKLKVSSKTAYRWMNMARALQAKYGELTGEERMRSLLSTSPQHWTTDDTQLVKALVDGMTDGKSAVDFMAELGLTHRTVRAPVKSSLPGEVQVLMADRKWLELERRLNAYEGKFDELGVEAVRAQVEYLSGALTARRLWLERKQAA